MPDDEKRAREALPRHDVGGDPHASAEKGTDCSWPSAYGPGQKGNRDQVENRKRKLIARNIIYEANSNNEREAYSEGSGFAPLGQIFE